ncbi:MAG: enoyl-CoA hydratase/isomerase family protein [Actinomycetota bacterium]
MAGERVIEVIDRDRVRLVTFDRPEALNAFDDAMYHATARALTYAAADAGIACVVLTGRGRAFSAGQDLGEMSRIDPTVVDPGATPGSGFPHFLDTLADFPKPVIAAVNGLGVGVGLTMLLHVDLALISETARLRAPFVPLGVVPEAAGSLLMPLVMGGQRAAEKLYTGEWISAEEAVECGLARRVVPPDRLLAEALDLAGRIARMPVASLRATKELVVAARRDAVRATRDREDAAFARLVGAPANLEAITAFLEKREPDFRGL